MYIEEILSQIFPLCQVIMTDNENIFTSSSSKAVYDRLNISHVTTPLTHSTSNAQVERVHSTILEIAKSLAYTSSGETVDHLFDAIKQYNMTLHSVTKEKPLEVFFNQSKFPHIASKIEKKQEEMLKYHNSKRGHKIFHPGETIYVKNNRRRKDHKSYSRLTVKEDRKDTVQQQTTKLYIKTVYEIRISSKKIKSLKPLLIHHYTNWGQFILDRGERYKIKQTNI